MEDRRLLATAALPLSTSAAAAHLDWFHTYLGGEPSPWDPKALAGNAVFGTESEKREAKP